MSDTTKPREKLALTADQAKDIVYGYNKQEYSLIVDDIIDQGRWTTTHKVVVKRLSDNRFFRDGYRVGSTEMQDESPWEYDAPAFTEVFPVEKTVIDYV